MNVIARKQELEHQFQMHDRCCDEGLFEMIWKLPLAIEKVNIDLIGCDDMTKWI